jgi:hypothetical protein
MFQQKLKVTLQDNANIKSKSTKYT